MVEHFGVWDTEGEIECPRCGEADYRHEGTNICGLCECRFYVIRQKKPHIVSPTEREP